MAVDTPCEQVDRFVGVEPDRRSGAHDDNVLATLFDVEVESQVGATHEQVAIGGRNVEVVRAVDK